MSHDPIYKKLANISFGDEEGEIERIAPAEANIGHARQYSLIHRNRVMSPVSLKAVEESDSVGIPSTSIDTFIIPKMRQ